MSGFIQGIGRGQSTLFPEQLDDYVTEDNPVRVIDAFVESMDLRRLGFQTDHAVTGRPGYHPSTLIKLFVYGYLNKIQSSRRLESEAQRNVELMWLTEKLAPDFKTVANFRKDNGKGLKSICREFVLICRKLELLTGNFVAIDGSKFRAVNNRDKNYTQNKIQSRIKAIDQYIESYFLTMEKADQIDEQSASEIKVSLENKIGKMQKEIEKLRSIDETRIESPDQQISITDPDSRAMHTRMPGFVGYNLQAAVDVKSHLIVGHEVTNTGVDRSALYETACLAKEAIGCEKLRVVADRGYYNGVELLACEAQNIEAYVLKTKTSNSLSRGLYDKADFKWIKQDQEYQCPAGQRLIFKSKAWDRKKRVRVYGTKHCLNCDIKAKCTSAKYRKVTRWVHEAVYERTEQRMIENPEMMRIRKSTVEHPFGTIKDWMGHTHFKMKTLTHVSTEMSLHVLAYNFKRVLKILGYQKMMEAMIA